MTKLIDAFIATSKTSHKNSVRTSQEEAHCVPMTVRFNGIITVYVECRVERRKCVAHRMTFVVSRVKTAISQYLLSEGFPSDDCRR